MRAGFSYWLGLIAVALLLGPGVTVWADEAPISGIVKTVDTAAGTLLVESASKGKIRHVVIHVRPDSKIVRFVHSPAASGSGHREQPATLADVKPGWTVTVKTKHEGDKEVAEIVRVVHEK